jgi:hypothetical protein
MTAIRLAISIKVVTRLEFYKLSTSMFIQRSTMLFARLILGLTLLVAGFSGCGDNKTVIPNAPFTEEQKKAIKAEDSKIADEESHGAKRR